MGGHVAWPLGVRAPAVDMTVRSTGELTARSEVATGFGHFDLAPSLLIGMSPSKRTSSPGLHTKKVTIVMPQSLSRQFGSVTSMVIGASALVTACGVAQPDEGALSAQHLATSMLGSSPDAQRLAKAVEAVTVAPNPRRLAPAAQALITASGAQRSAPASQALPEALVSSAESTCQPLPSIPPCYNAVCDGDTWDFIPIDGGDSCVTTGGAAGLCGAGPDAGECIVPTTGALIGSYYILAVEYSPPNAGSLISYGSGNSWGSSTTTKSSWKNEVNVTYDHQFDLRWGSLDAQITAGRTDEWSTSDETTIKTTMMQNFTINGHVDTVDHGYDKIYLWLNPQINITIYGSTVAWSLSTQPGTNPKIMYVTPAWLLHGPVPPDELRELQDAGIGPNDYWQILSTDPYAQSTPIDIDTNRFVWQTEIPYEPVTTADGTATTSTYAITTSTAHTAEHETSVTYDIDVKLVGSIGFKDLVRTKITTEDKFSHTSNNKASHTLESSLSATATIRQPAFGFSGGTRPFLDVYLDSVYNTFLFVLRPWPTVGPITGFGGKCVDVDGGNTVDGTKVQLWSCNGTGAQQWALGSDGTIRALGKCLDVYFGGTANGTRVDLATCNGTGSQLWQRTATQQLINPQSGACLDATGPSSADGTPLQIWACTRGANQQWQKWEVVSTPPGPITGLAGKCVDVPGGSTVDGTTVQLWTCNGTGAQQWTLGADNTVRALGKCLDVGGTTNGAKVDLSSCNGSGGQQWLRTATNQLINLQSGACLDATDKNSADGTPLQIWACWGGNNQRWDVVSTR